MWNVFTVLTVGISVARSRPQEKDSNICVMRLMYVLCVERGSSSNHEGGTEGSKIPLCVFFWSGPFFKGILHQKNFYRLNLIFWIVMGCGIARFGRRGLKTTETWKFWSQNLSPGVLRRGAPGVSRHSATGFRGAAQGFRGAAPRGFEGQHHW